MNSSEDTTVYLDCEMCKKAFAVYRCLVCNGHYCDKCMKEHEKTCKPKRFWDD